MRARFRARVAGRFDGAIGATVVISGGPDPTFIVRPLRRRRVYALPLSAVARSVLFDVVRTEVATRRRTKAGR